MSSKFSALEAGAELEKDFCLFFGGNESKEICFWDLLTIRQKFMNRLDGKKCRFWTGQFQGQFREIPLKSGRFHIHSHVQFFS